MVEDCIENRGLQQTIKLEEEDDDDDDNDDHNNNNKLRKVLTFKNRASYI
jgi:hypothetical protein